MTRDRHRDRPGGGGPARLHHRRAASADLGDGRAVDDLRDADVGGARRRRTRPACATSTSRGRTGGPRSSWPAGSPRARTRPTSDRVEVGLPLRRRTGASTPTPTRSRTTRSRRSASSAPRRSRCSAGAWRVYHVHAATLETGVLDDRRAARGAGGAARRRVRVGISTSGPQQADAVRRALEVEVGGAPLFTSFQSTWNVLETSVGAGPGRGGGGRARR